MSVAGEKAWVTYHLAMLLTGHGCFQSYRQRIGKTTEENCPYSEQETVEHTLFTCKRWKSQRAELTEQLEGISADPQMIVAIMRLKEEDERTWQKGRNAANA
jgi:hypothetical protein